MYMPNVSAGDPKEESLQEEAIPLVREGQALVTLLFQGWTYDDAKKSSSS